MFLFHIYSLIITIAHFSSKHSFTLFLLQIHDGNVKIGTFRGTELHGKNITSRSNVISVVLTSCSSSLLFDRRGMRVSYSTGKSSTSLIFLAAVENSWLHSNMGLVEIRNFQNTVKISILMTFVLFKITSLNKT